MQLFEKQKRQIRDYLDDDKKCVKKELDQWKKKTDALRVKFSNNSSLFEKNPYEDEFNEVFSDYCRKDKEYKEIDKINDRDFKKFEDEFESKRSENEDKIKTAVGNLTSPTDYHTEINELNSQIEDSN